MEWITIKMSISQALPLQLSKVMQDVDSALKSARLKLKLYLRRTGMHENLTYMAFQVPDRMQVCVVRALLTPVVDSPGVEKALADARAEYGKFEQLFEGRQRELASAIALDDAPEETKERARTFVGWRCKRFAEWGGLNLHLPSDRGEWLVLTERFRELEEEMDSALARIHDEASRCEHEWGVPVHIRKVFEQGRITGACIEKKTYL